MGEDPHRRVGSQPEIDGAELRLVVSDPDGQPYQIVGEAKEWKLGTGSLALDAAALVWALVRRARGRDWVVTVRRAQPRSETIMTRKVRSEVAARSTVVELGELVQSGRLAHSLGGDTPHR